MTDAKQSTVLSVIGTVKSKLSDLSIKNGQLIFVQDSQKIALDFNGKRVFYNQIVILKTEQERQELLAPVEGLFYFVLGTAVLWTYSTDWIQVTNSPEEILFVGTTLPELGSEKTIYVNKANKNISIWDKETNTYIIVGESYGSISNRDIDVLF